MLEILYEMHSLEKNICQTKDGGLEDKSGERK